MRKLTCLLIVGLLLPPHAWAADYRVDLIILLNRDAPTDIAMSHGLAVRPSVTTGSVDIRDQAELKRAGFSLLPEASFGLDSEWRKLRSSSRFRPIQRMAWRVTERATATAIRLHDDLVYQVMPELPIATGMLITQTNQTAYQKYRMDGKLLVQQSAGLRVNLDLEYTLPVTAAPADYPASTGQPLALSTTELRTLRLHAEKRVNLGQTHFFDHPLLGVLLRVSPAG